MNSRRIIALIRRDVSITKRLKYKIVETFYFPITSTLIWGFFTLWLGDMSLEAAFMLLAANLFWSFGYQSQSNANQQMMEDRWSESFKQLMLTPLRPLEYLAGKIIFAVFWSSLSFVIILLVAYFFFGFTVLLQKILYFLFFALVTMISSMAISTLVGALITILGNQYDFLSWSTIQLFILFSAPFFPITIYPPIIRTISKVMPYTWMFESIRMLLSTGRVEPYLLVKSLLVSLTYFFISLPVYSFMFEISRKRGRLANPW